jgi:hypothetical protein
MHEKASLMKVNFSLKFLLIYRGFFISMQLFLLHYHPIILTPFTNVASSTAIEIGDNVCSIADTLTEVIDKIFVVTPQKQKLTSQ